MTNKYYSYHLLLLCFIAAFCLQNALAQPYQTNPDYNRANNWLFGDSIWLDFAQIQPTLKKVSFLNIVEATSSISDKVGQLLLYSNGYNVFDFKGDTILNGKNLHADFSSHQGCVIVPYPGDDSLFYLFNIDANVSKIGLTYNLISIKNKKGLVVEKNILLVPNVNESISVTKHNNGLFYWITVHGKNNDLFYSYLITNYGLNLCPSISKTGLDFSSGIFNSQMTSKFNLAGNRLAITLFQDGKIQLFNFNNSTGILDNPITFSGISMPFGLEFSNDSKWLYCVSRDSDLWQLDISNVSFKYSIYNNSLSSKIGIQRFHNKLFIGQVDSSYLSIIQNPNGLKENCDFDLKGLKMSGFKISWGLPNFPQNYFYTPAIDFAYSSDCITNTISFEGRDTFMAPAHLWQFKRKYASGLNVAATKSPLHTFTDTGVYEVMYIASNGSRSDTALKNITIYPKINKQFLGADTGYCQGSIPSILLAAPAGMHCYLWSNGSTSQSITIDTAGVYWVKITTPSFCTLWDTIQVTELQPVPKPFIWLSNDTLYSSVTGNYQFRWLKNGQLASTSKNFFKTSQSGNYTLALSNGNGCDSLSNEVDVSLSLFTPSNINVLVYPNPSSESIQINGLTPDGKSKWVLTAMDGKIIQSGNSGSINTKSINPGCYILSLQIPDKNLLHFKIIINHP